MNKKKKKNPAAEDLIESLMEDIQNENQHGSANHKKANLSGDFNMDEFVLPEESARGGKRRMGDTIWGDLGVELKDVHQSDAVKEKKEYTHEDINNDYQTNSEFDTPANFDLPSTDSEKVSKLDIPIAEEEKYQGPSAGDGEFQNIDDIYNAAPPVEHLSQVASTQDDATKNAAANDATKLVGESKDSFAVAEDKTVSIQGAASAHTRADVNDLEKTLAVEGFANAKLGAKRAPEPEVKVSIGQLRGGSSSSRASGHMFGSVDASLLQAENLKLAQQRILDLEKEVEKLRAENEELASAGDIVRQRSDEYSVKMGHLEKDKAELIESHQSELLILKGNLQYKETEVAKARLKIEELESRLKSDFKKIRVKERELENRLELVRAEKQALVRSKDEYILELKRKIDQQQSEIDNYRGKVLELNKSIESNHEQFKRTVRALRLALSNLEVKEENVVPLKKAD